MPEAENKLVQKRRGMAEGGYVSPFSMPQSAGPNDILVGQDDAGRDVYETLTGRRYTIGLDPDQRTPRRKVSDAIKAGKTAIKEWWEDPDLPSGEQVKDAAVGLVKGAYDEVDRLVHDEGTMGEALGVTPITTLPSFIRAKPKTPGKKVIEETEEAFTQEINPRDNDTIYLRNPTRLDEVQLELTGTQWDELLEIIEERDEAGEFILVAEKEDLLDSILYTAGDGLTTYDGLRDYLNFVFDEGQERTYVNIFRDEVDWDVEELFLEDTPLPDEITGVSKEKPKTPPPPAKEKQVVKDSFNPKENPLIKGKGEKPLSDMELNPQSYYRGVRVDDLDPAVIKQSEFIEEYAVQKYRSGNISSQGEKELREAVVEFARDPDVQKQMTDSQFEAVNSETFENLVSDLVYSAETATDFIRNLISESDDYITLQSRLTAKSRTSSYTPIVSFYNPIVSSLEAMDWPSKGAKGSVINSYIDSKASGVRKSLWDSVKSKSVGKIHGEQQLFDPSKRYTLEEATQIINDNSFTVEAVKVPSEYEGMQRFSDRDVMDPEVEYDEVILKTSGNKMGRRSNDHYDDSSIGHTRYSTRQTYEGEKYILVEELQSDLVQGMSEDVTPMRGAKLPPINSVTEYVRPLIHAIIVDAKRKGVGKVVIPDADSIIDVRDGEFGDYHARKRTGFENIYDKAVNKVLAELDREKGVDVSIGSDTVYGKGDDWGLEGDRPIATPVRVINLEALDFDPDNIELRFAEGGLVPDMDEQTEMAFMSEGQRVDPVSGNEVPPGSTPEEVRDDVPAKLSEGEFVVPADVVKYFGVKYFYDLIRKGKEGMSKEMDDLPFDASELQYEEEQPQQ